MVSQQINMVEALAKIILKVEKDIAFTIMEVGALPLDNNPEPFYQLLDYFPDSNIIAFEVDQKLCDDLNKKHNKNIKFYCNAIGKKEETRKFYNTVHPMCSSLYKPDEPLLKMYNSLEVVEIKSIESIDTISLDSFVDKHKIEKIDFIKIDIQGAELEVFEGGIKTLKETCAILSEVEFIKLYEDQPLFGDVSSFLEKQGICFHHFLGIAGRALKPLILNNNVNHPSQHMWADAFFIKDIHYAEKIGDKQLLKIAVLSAVYNVPDVTVFCLNQYDLRKKTNLQDQFISLFN
ncbi:MAG: hypothetical protein COB02_09885 [Candidatus Cloacimonadota bacterium]|nr:MAG: hypothetical protein COB02_09885 [Candidatus Cloacimonadota bacterium]